MKVGILSGGGDAPGTNAVIRAAVRKGILYYKYQMVGIKDGWRGLLDADFMPLTLDTIRGILPRGGSILGSSRTNPFKHQDGSKKIFENVTNHDINAIIVIGGDDTQSIALKLYEMGLPCVSVPKTIDNDLAGTDYTVGFNTAVWIATEALDRIHTTADTHHRVMIVEVMGRNAGWIAFESGLAGGADVILIPEQCFDIDEVCNYVKQRQIHGRNYSVIVVAEGAKPKGRAEITYNESVDEFGHVRLGGVGHYLSKEIEKCTGIETRVVILGHLQRGGSPTPYDRILATRYGISAIDLIHERKFGQMVALKCNNIVPIPLKDVADKSKTVDSKLYEMAKVFFG
jgi:6-phosphofructokinase 1